MSEQELQNQINSNLYESWKDGLFGGNGGCGMLFRFQADGMEYIKDQQEVLPATFLHNSIETPNPAYNLLDEKEDPFCKKHGGLKGELVPVIGTLVTDPSKMDTGPLWSFNPRVDKYNKNGVFYAHDSNSCDQRAIWYGPKNMWIGNGFYENNDKTGKKIKDTSSYGSGAFQAGSPLIDKSAGGGGGGGTGYHVIFKRSDIVGPSSWISDDQLSNEAYSNVDFNGEFYRGWEATCLINYADYITDCTSIDSINEWEKYINQFAFAYKNKRNDPPWKYYSDDINSLGDAFGWVDNIRAMIGLQNALYRFRSTWFNNCDKKYYWGWNEIPMNAQAITNPDNFGCLAVILPINGNESKYGFKDLASIQQEYVKFYLKKHHDMGFKYKYVAFLNQEESPNRDGKMCLNCTDVMKYPI